MVLCAVCFLLAETTTAACTQLLAETANWIYTQTCVCCFVCFAPVDVLPPGGNEEPSKWDHLCVCGGDDDAWLLPLDW